MDVGDILDRLGLRIDGHVTRAAQMLYGTKFLPDYPQALLKLGRFRGTKITGDILDNKQEYLHAFAMVREAIAWLDRTLPLSARFPKGAINREDRLPVPAEALREIVINAVIHRDVSDASSYVAIAVFDDRIEIHSIGEFPTGMRAELLTREHRSIPRNPLIAGAFHRTGAIEVWGRGTNRVIEACRAYGIVEPTFTEASGAVTVTFKAEVVADLGRGPSQVGPKSVLSAAQVQVLEIASVARSLRELMAVAPEPRAIVRLTSRFRGAVIRELLRLKTEDPSATWARVGSDVRASIADMIGKDIDGIPLMGHRRHTEFLTWCEDGEPTRLLVWRGARAFDEYEQEAMLRAAARNLSWAAAGSDNDEWKVRLIPLDRSVPPPPGFDGSAARYWESVTPYVPPRHHLRGGKERERESLLSQVRRELLQRGFVDAEQVDVSAIGDPVCVAVHVPRRKASRRTFLGDRRGQAVRLTFPSPVAGPIRLGHSSSFGLGLFHPVVGNLV